MDKLYIYRKHDQWRGKPIYVEDEIDENGYQLQLPDVDMKRGNINVISVEFEDSEGKTYALSCDVVDYDKRIIGFHIPNSILNNKGLYYAVFTISFNSNGNAQGLDRSAKQSFRILETIEVDNGDIEEEENYPILLSLIEELSQYKVDTSNFPTFKDLEDMINASMEEVSVEAIMALIKQKGYITKEDVIVYLTSVISNYATKFELGDYAKKLDLQKYVTTNDLNSLYLWHYVKTSDFNTRLENFVEKDGDKVLSSNDFTDELKEKLENIQDYIDTDKKEEDDNEEEDKEDFEISQELLDKINSSVSLSKLQEDYYSKEQVAELHVNLAQSLLNMTLYNETAKIEYFNSGLELIREKGETLDVFYLDWSLSNISDTDMGYTLLSLEILTEIDRVLEVDFVNLNLTDTFYEYTKPISANTEFHLILQRDGYVIDKKELYVAFVNPIYYGVANDLDSIYREFTQQGKMLNNSNEFEFTVSYNDAIPFFALEKSKEIADIKDNNGLSYKNSFENISYTINGTEYAIYYLPTKATCTDMRFIISIKEEDDNGYSNRF